jgi:hypothetical protein
MEEVIPSRSPKYINNPGTLICTADRDEHDVTPRSQRTVVSVQRGRLVRAPLSQPKQPGTQPVTRAGSVEQTCPLCTAENVYRRHVHTCLMETAEGDLDARIVVQDRDDSTHRVSIKAVLVATWLLTHVKLLVDATPRP